MSGSISASSGECDTAGIQLLLMACAGARAKGKGFAIVGQTAAFRAALDRLGIPIECIDAAAAGPDDGTGDRMTARDAATHPADRCNEPG